MELRDRLPALHQSGKVNIILNLKDVSDIDSTGLGILVSAHVSAQKQGTAVHLSDLGKKFHDLLQLTRLLTVFSVYATEADAISSFGVLAQAVTA